MSTCACGSTKTYNECCEPFITGKQTPATPEQLMRSRYTAYTQVNIAYIQQTMQGKATLGYDPANAQQWAQSVEWLDLKVVNAPPTAEKIGHVEFIARFKQQGQVHLIHEVSEFQQQNGRWYYTDGEQQPTPQRNSLCPCGSGRKFKRCCNQ